MRRLLILTVVVVCAVSGAAQKKARQAEDVGDDYSDFSAQPVKNAGANHQLKQVTYSTIAPKFDIPTRTPTLNSNRVQTTTKKPVVVDYRRGYYFQHYPWDRLPRQYLLRPGMTYVYPPQFHHATYRYPYLPYTDPYNIYRSHPGIGSGCGGGQAGGCGGGYAQAYQGYGQSSSGCGASGGTGCGGFDDDEDEDSYEDDEEEEGGKSGEAKINKKDPLEDLELEDLEKLSSDKKTSTSDALDDADEAEPTEIKKTSSTSDDEDLVDDRKKAKKNFLVKWA